MTLPRLTLLALAAFAAATGLHAQGSGNELLKPDFDLENLAAPPGDLSEFAVGQSGGQVLLAGGMDTSRDPQTAILQLDASGTGWVKIGDLPEPLVNAAAASSDTGMIIVGGQVDDRPATTVVRVTVSDGAAVVTSMPDLPQPVREPTVSIAGGFIYVAGQRVDDSERLHPSFMRIPYEKSLSFLQKLLSGVGFNFTPHDVSWEILPAWDGPALDYPEMAFSFESTHIFGISAEDGSIRGYGYGAGKWRSLATPEFWNSTTTMAPFGESHIFTFTERTDTAEDELAILAYHTLTNTWVEIGTWNEKGDPDAKAVAIGDHIYVVSGDSATGVTILPPANNYGWVDHIVVIIYLIGMVAMGAWFVRKEKNTTDYFRASNKVPWWAIGMSLFATAASAISLMTMPGKSYSGNWTFFAISIYSALCLPLSLFLLAPLVRKLNISTANEYLELRFGLTARMVGSVIYMVNQILGRMAPVIFLPSIAMSAITGIDIWIWILVIGTVTTIYTFLGGLSAVIWTDTIQGLIMLGTVAGCLILILFKLDMPLSEMWTTLHDYDKLHVFDWGWDITQPVVIMVFTGTIFITLLGIGDQNYVQRVQAAPTLKDAKKAVATQMAVAIPINVLLFGLGTALYLYYKLHPIELNPVMKTDGVYPLFAAQHLPVGVSGLVIAALLAASMSTISSAICSVANLGVDDFYRRFKADVTERSALIIARVMTGAVGLIGIIGALFLAQSDSKSVWDAALIITGLITNGTVGLFGLGLLSKRAHELGALLGLLAGTIVTIYLDAFTPVTYWLYAAAGSTVTLIVGYLCSIILPCPRKPLDGLTVYTLDKPRRHL